MGGTWTRSSADKKVPTAATPSHLRQLLLPCVCDDLLDLILAYVGSNIHGHLLHTFPCSGVEALAVNADELVVSRHCQLETLSRRTGVRRVIPRSNGTLSAVACYGSDHTYAHAIHPGMLVSLGPGEERQFVLMKCFANVPCTLVVGHDFLHLHRYGSSVIERYYRDTLLLDEQHTLPFHVPQGYRVEMCVLEPTAELFLTDFYGGRIWVMDLVSWTVRRKWGQWELRCENDIRIHPAGLCVVGDEVMVLNCKDATVRVYAAATGEFLRKWECGSAVRKIATDGVSVFGVSDQGIHWFH